MQPLCLELVAGFHRVIGAFGVIPRISVHYLLGITGKRYSKYMKPKHPDFGPKE